jgi:hypothetical protein
VESIDQRAEPESSSGHGTPDHEEVAEPLRGSDRVSARLLRDSAHERYATHSEHDERQDVAAEHTIARPCVRTDRLFTSVAP